MRWFIAAGLSLLYGSAYFLPLVNPTQRYFIPSLWTYIVAPTLIVVAVLSPAFVLADRMLVAHGYRRSRTFLSWALCTLLVLLAIAGALSAADWSLDTFIAPKSITAEHLMEYRRLRVAVPSAIALCAATALWISRSRLPKLLEFLSLLGYAFAALAILRIANHPPADTVASRPPPATASGIAAPRRVVWVIFDELDYEETLGAASGWTASELPNLTDLRSRAASATEAYSPAKDTEESVPGLLMGTPVQGSRIDPDGSLWIRVATDESRRFAEAATLFAHLPGGPASAALLGYFHPYCRILTSLAACQSYFLGNVGRWFDGLLPFSNSIAGMIRWTPGVATHIPDSVVRIVDPMFRISTELAHAVPQALGRSDLALTFIHYNIPHYPADYAQRTLALHPRPADNDAYRDNLRLVDRRVGEIIRQLTAVHSTAPGQDLLLLLSSDHWHRMSSLTVARRVPFLAWHVGENAAATIPMPISTLHTGALILDFLNGKVTTQAEIGRWWHDKPVFPTWIPGNQKF